MNRLIARETGRAGRDGRTGSWGESDRIETVKGGRFVELQTTRITAVEKPPCGRELNLKDIGALVDGLTDQSIDQ